MMAKKTTPAKKQVDDQSTAVTMKDGDDGAKMSAAAVTAEQDKLVAEAINAQIASESNDVADALRGLAGADPNDPEALKKAAAKLEAEVDELLDATSEHVKSLVETYDWHDIQRRLKNLGFYKGNIDGIRGPKTNAAIIRFKQSINYKARDYYGPLTHKALMGARSDLPRVRETPGNIVEDLPWMAEIEHRMGLHEIRDNAELKEWLKGGMVGIDPAKIPWCGDMIETAIYGTLPNEPKFANPLLARNWKNFGVDCDPQYGCVAHFWRTHPTKSLNGHVAFLIGYDPVRDRYRIRGGNQSNMLRDDWIDADRLLGTQWPSSYPETNIPLPVLNSAGQPVSKNEA